MRMRKAAVNRDLQTGWMDAPAHFQWAAPESRKLTKNIE